MNRTKKSTKDEVIIKVERGNDPDSKEPKVCFICFRNTPNGREARTTKDVRHAFRFRSVVEAQHALDSESVQTMFSKINRMEPGVTGVTFPSVETTITLID